MIRVKTIDGVKGFVNTFHVKNPKKIEFWKAMNKHNPNYVKIWEIDKK